MAEEAPGQPPDWARAGRAVARRRAQLRLGSQEEAAARAGLGVETWRKVERGKGPRRTGTLALIALALEWPADMIERIAAGEPAPDVEEERALRLLERGGLVPGTKPEEDAQRVFISTHSGDDFSDLPDEVQDEVRAFIEFKRAQLRGESHR